MASFVVLSAVGCGNGGEVETGANVTIYAGASICSRAKAELQRAGARAGSVRARVVCAPAVESGGRLNLAAAGANARAATQDSSSVAYLEAPGPAISFIRPILDEAEIRMIVDRSGSRSMATVLDALDSARSGESPRESVWAGG
jgi:hypothetical protein